MRDEYCQQLNKDKIVVRDTSETVTLRTFPPCSYTPPQRRVGETGKGKFVPSSWEGVVSCPHISFS